MDCHLTLPAELGIYAAGDLHRALSQLLDGLASDSGLPTTVRLDARQVETVDAAGIQLLLAFAADVHARGLTLALVTPSAVLQRGLERIGADHAFNLEPVASAA